MEVDIFGGSKEHEVTTSPNQTTSKKRQKTTDEEVRAYPDLLYVHCNLKLSENEDLKDLSSKRNFREEVIHSKDDLNGGLYFSFNPVEEVFGSNVSPETTPGQEKKSLEGKCRPHWLPPLDTSKVSIFSQENEANRQKVHHSYNAALHKTYKEEEFTKGDKKFKNAKQSKNKVDGCIGIVKPEKYFEINEAREEVLFDPEKVEENRLADSNQASFHLKDFIEADKRIFEGLDPLKSKISPRTIRSRERKRRRILKQNLPELSLELIMKHRSILNQLGQVEIISETQYELKEVIKYGPYVGPLRLYLIRKGEDQERPMMPCSNVGFIHDNVGHRHGYEEPIRDRNKNWRELLWTGILPKLKEHTDDFETRPQLKVPPPHDEIDPETWGENFKKQLDMSKVFTDGVLLSKIKILRLGIRLGEKPFIMTVYGMGIAGRVYMEHPQFPRHLLVEAYCPLDLSHYELRIELETLVAIFPGKMRRLLDPGHKRELCGYIVKMIWYDVEEDVLKIGPDIQISTAELRRKEREEERRRREKELEAQQRALERQNQVSRGRPDINDPANWRRNQGVVTRMGAIMGKHNIIVTVLNHIRRQTTYIIHLYDPVTSNQLDMPISVRELARIAEEEKKIQLWENDTKLSVCRRVVPFICVHSEANTSAIKLQNRIGIPGKMFRNRLSLNKTILKRKKETPVGLNKIINQLQSLGEESVTQQQQSYECGRRNIALYSRKTPLRNIAKGKVLLCGSTRISKCHFIYTVYHVKGSVQELYYNMWFYCVNNSKYHIIDVTEEDMYAYMKTGKHSNVERENISKAVHIEFSERLIMERIKMHDPNKIGKIHLNRTIYKNCCRVYDRRFQPVDKRHRLPGGIYCMATVEQNLGKLLFKLFEPKRCLYLYYEMPKLESLELIKEFESMTPLEREIQITTHFSSMVIDRDEKTGELTLDILDMDTFLSDEEDSDFENEVFNAVEPDNETEDHIFRENSSATHLSHTDIKNDDDALDTPSALEPGQSTDNATYG